MDIDKLKQLADTVERGVVEFPELSRVVVLDMSVEYCNLEQDGSYKLPVRSDIPEPSKVTACACGIGFTIALFSPLKSNLYNKTFTQRADLFTEATLILDLTREQAIMLFLHRMSRFITGEQFARVIRNLLLTGKVDWMIIETA